MRLEDLGRQIAVPGQDGPGQQHPQGLPADQPGSDHSPSDPQDVFQGQVALDQLEHPLFAGDQHAQKPAQERPGRFRLGVAAPDRFDQLLRLDEGPLPGAGADL